MQHRTNVKLTKDIFVKKSIITHGNIYDYSESIYLTNKHKITIKCLIHGFFNQEAKAHMTGQGCPKCGVLKQGPISTKNKLISKFKNINQPDDYKLIPLSKGLFAKVDNEDFERVKLINWFYQTKYAYSAIKGKQIGLHNFIMNCPKGKIVDHKNHDPLDNRKQNLRICTYSNNNMNRMLSTGFSSKYKGVIWSKVGNKWESRIKLNKKNIYIGRYHNEEEAAKAYDEKAIELFGEFAYTNFKQNE